MKLAIDPSGALRGLYTDTVDWRALGDALGSLSIHRASHVEPTPEGLWDADMTPSGGPASLGPFPLRQAALDAEVAWLQEHRL